MANKKRTPDNISRRDFASRLGAAAGVVAGSQFFTPGVQARAQAGARVVGANDRVVLASIGIRGQGNSLKRNFARVPNVDIKTLCDVDANLEASRVNDPQLKDVPSFKPGFVQDLRRVLDDKDIDAVVIATPNHWHALATIWAMQAGKHVYVEKPSSHTVWEGRKMVEATARYGKIVQTGFMNRSRPAVIEAIKFMNEGGLGKVYMARGLCFKPRPAIGKYPDGPMAPGEKYALTVTSTSFEPTYDEAYLSKVDYNLWLGPAPLRPFNRNRFHYNWHWHWDYGNGDTGNQGPHQFDIARWGLNKKEHPVKIQSSGGYFGAPASQDTPDTQTALFDTRMAPSSSSPRVDSSRTMKAACGSAICSMGRRAGSGLTRPGATGSRFWGPRMRRDRDWRRRFRAPRNRPFRPTTRTSSTPSGRASPGC